jgi:hypothetical protein
MAGTSPAMTKNEGVELFAQALTVSISPIIIRA